MRAVAAVAVAAVVMLGASACGDDEPNEPAASALASASSVAASIASEVASAGASAASDAASMASSAASSAMSEASSAAASAVSEAVPAGSPAPSPTAARPADNTVLVEVQGKKSYVYAPQNCSTVPGVDGFSMAGQADGGGQLVLVGEGGGRGNITVLGGEVGAGNGTVSDLVINPDGTFWGTSKFLELAVTFYGHCDALKK